MRFKSLIAMTGAVAAVAAFLALPAQAQTKPAAKQQMAPVCANCHEAQWNSIDLSPHGAKSDADGGMCQACHGDASQHLKDPTKNKPANPFAKGGTADARTAVCMTCHSGNRNLAFWTSGKHQLNEVTCSNCHSIHGKKLAPSINKFVDDVPAEPGRHLRQLPPADPRGDAQAVASPDPRRQGEVQRLPQPARRDHAGDAEAADDQRPVLLLPRRQARSVRVQPPAGRGELRDLPQPARFRAREAAERIGAEPVPGLPRLVAAPRHDLRCGRCVQLPAGRHTRCRAASRSARRTGQASPTRA